MSGFELNKIAGAVLLAGLIAMVVGTIADALYHPELSPEKRGFQIVVEDGATPATEKPKEEVIDIAALINSADVGAGKKLSKKCTACHSFDKGGANKVGPALWGVLGRAKGAGNGYNYSDAIMAKGGDWDYDALFAFLQKPKAFVPGTKMAFAGIKKPKDVASLILFMRDQNDAPIALPVATPVSAVETPEAEAASEVLAEEPQENVNTPEEL